MTTYVFPAPRRAEPYVALGKTASGTCFKKHVANLGSVLTGKNGKRVKVDHDLFNALRASIGTARPSIPLVNSSNAVDERPEHNLGEVLDLSLDLDTGKIFAMLDIRDPDAVPRLGSTYLGSACVIDGKTRALQHVAVTNRPSLHLDGYEKMAMSLPGDTVALTATGETMTTTDDVLTHDDILGAMSEAAQQWGVSSADVEETLIAFCDEAPGVQLSDRQAAEALSVLIGMGPPEGVVALTANVPDAESFTDAEVLRLTGNVGTGVSGGDDPDSEVSKIAQRHGQYFHQDLTDEDPDAPSSEGRRLHGKSRRRHPKARPGSKYPAHERALGEEPDETTSEAVDRISSRPDAADMFVKRGA